MEQFVQNFQIYLLIMARFYAIFMVAPILSSPVIENRIKLALAFISTAVVFPLVANVSVFASTNTVAYILSIINEVMIGILIGFLFSIIYATLQVATSFFEVQIGFRITDTIDPLSQISIPIVGQLQNLMGMLIFVSINGHYMIIRTLVYSFERIPVLSEAAKSVFTLNLEAVINHLIYYFSSLFSIGLSLALPIMVTLFLLSISLGLLAKAAPQMNILLLGLPFQIALGMITYLFLIPVVAKSFVSIVETTFKDISILIEYLGVLSV